MEQNDNKKRFKNKLHHYIALIFTLIFGVIGCQNSDKGQYTEYGNDQRQQEAAPQKNVETLQGNIPENRVVVEKGDMRYFISRDGNRSDYQTRVGLYRQEINKTTAERLVYDYVDKPQLAGDFVYYLNDNHQLCRVNIKAAKPQPEMVAEGVDLYSLYDHWAYYWNRSDTCLYFMDLTDIKGAPQKIGEFKDMDVLVARGDFVLAENRLSEETGTTIQIWKVSLNGSKKDLLMSDPGWNVFFIQPYQNYIYYLENNAIWRLNITEKSKEKVYTPDDADIHEFIVNNNRIYIEEFTHTGSRSHIYFSVNLDGNDNRHIFTYRSPIGTQGSAVNGTMEEVHMFGFDVTQDYLFLTGASYYHGEILTTRIPIAGDAGRKKEEVFFNGAWGSIEDYIKETERVHASEGLK